MALIFKTIDEKLEDLGYIKQFENGVCTSYERREVGKYKHQKFYYHVVDITDNFINSYQRGINSDKLNNSVKLNYKELRLFLNKMKKIRKKYFKK